MKTYTNVFDLGDLKTALAEAFEIKKDRYKYEALGKHRTCLLIFFNNSLRTRLSTQKAARNLGMDVIVLDVVDEMLLLVVDVIDLLVYQIEVGDPSYVVELQSYHCHHEA